MIDEAWAGSSPLTRGKPCVRYAGCSRAHPRSCGENVRTPCAFSLPYGSSPLTRGKHHIPDCDVMTLGLIPAHAGKTKSPGGCQGCGWAHPHSCGENAKARGYRTMCMGSSPLARGKQAASRGCCVAARLIPAHAGKTRPMPSGTRAPRAHPRSRGENAGIRQPARPFSGSSPLSRGKHPTPPRGVGERGLIPAHAGKTRGPGYGMRVGQAPPRSREENSSDPWRRQRSRAPPHSRGENPKVVVFDNLMDGSSPLTRGKPIRVLAVRGDLGLIPAHTGKTGTGCPSSPHPWAHPHSRGENAISMIKESQTAGSSPLTRGKLVHHRHDGLRARLIPAHAGKTASTCIARLRGRAHPRSGRENVA